jgi:lantibiotic modifying enzyme
MHHSHSPLSRRDAIRAALAGTSALVGLPPALRAQLEAVAPDATGRPHVENALRAARWLEQSAQRLPNGTAWPVDPLVPKEIQTDMYSGRPGVVLFLLELHGATGERRWLDQACAGADYLVATLPEKLSSETENAGLYTGVAGIAYVLEETARIADRAVYRTSAKRALEMLKTSAVPTGAGVAWNNSNDIISGSAGIGLYLLWAHARYHDDAALALAAKGARRLTEVGIPANGGLKWSFAPGQARTLPNFSHGAAGVSYFLASLYGETHERAFLDGAVQGATYLQAVATSTANGGRMVFHSEPGNEQLYYLSWCHGPAGTARLFHRLGAVTGDKAWSRDVDHLVQATLDSGIPEQRTPGFWNNISQCCGNCGVAEFFLSLNRLTGKPQHLDFARRCIDDTLRRSTKTDGDGLKWVQAETRVKPEIVVAQTGLMQGAAGVGLCFLHFDAAEQRRATVIELPDSPWRA